MVLRNLLYRVQYTSIGKKFKSRADSTARDRMHRVLHVISPQQNTYNITYSVVRLVTSVGKSKVV